MKKPTLLVREQYRVTAKLLGLAEPFVRQVATRLKTDSRLPATRPVASAVTPLTLARLLMGLCAPIPSKSTEIETTLGALPRATGDGADTAELELEALIAEAAGITEGDIDFWKGDLLIGVNSPALLITASRFDGTFTTRTYRASFGDEKYMTRYVRMPLHTMRMLALELMGD